LDPDSDQQLIQQCLNGDPEAFDGLVRRYQDRLVHSLEHAFGSREDALDTAQQAFISAWKQLGTFQQNSAFYTWLYRIAVNAAISKRRKQKLPTTSLDAHLSSGMTPEDQSDSAAPDSQLSAQERIQLVQEALSQVPEEFRHPLILKEIDGFTYEEISEALSIPIGTVRSRIFRARKEMTDRLQRIFRNE